MNLQNCKVNKYCSFKVILSKDDAQMEVCRYCHREVYYNIKNGQMDNGRYLRDHIRDFCQPTGGTSKVYEEIYGKGAMKKHKDLADEPDKRRRNQEALTSEFRSYMKGGDKSYFV